MFSTPFRRFSRYAETFGSPFKWKDALNSPGAIQMGVLKRILLGQKEWWNLVPDQSVFAECGNSHHTLSVAACSSTGEWILAYLGNNATITINMEKITAGNMVKSSWIDPTTGARNEIGRFANTGTQSFMTPSGWEDAVLLLEV